MDLIDSSEVARLLGVSTSTVNRRAVTGEIPTAQRTPGERGVRLFDRAAIEALATAAVADETRAAS